MNQGFPTSPANWFICYFAFHFLHIGWTGLFIILQICPTSMCFNTSVRCCSSLEFHVPFIFLYWNLMFPAYPFPYDCVSPILLQETDSFSQKANLLHKKYRANSQSLGNHRYHVRLESEIPENQTRKLLSPPGAPSLHLSAALCMSALLFSLSIYWLCILYVWWLICVIISRVQWKLTSYVLYPNILISWREKLRNPVEPMGWLPWVWRPPLDQPTLETGRRYMSTCGKSMYGPG